MRGAHRPIKRGSRIAKAVPRPGKRGGHPATTARTGRGCGLAPGGAAVEDRGGAMGESIGCESDGPVRHIALNAPQRLNALDRPMLAELAEAVRTVAADEAARALVVSGAGRAFCAGADVTSLFGDTTR